MDAWIAAPEAERVNRIDHEGLLMLMFTSGTTGRSKSGMLAEQIRQERRSEDGIVS